MRKIRKNVKRLALGIAIGIGLIGTSLYCVNMPNYNTNQIIEVKESRFDTARKDYRKRQKFLDELLINSDIPYCSGVIYDHDGFQIINYVRSEVSLLEIPENTEGIMQKYERQYKGGNYDAKTPEILQLSGQNRTSKIFIGRQIFEDFSYLTENDLKHIIVAHEGRHVELHALGLEYLSKEDLLSGFNNGSIRIPVLYEVGELDANAHALRRIFSGEFKVSNVYLNKTKAHFIINGLRLTAARQSSSPLEYELISNVQAKINSFPELWKLLNQKE